jgi:NAD(P)-dependent dehydrogenase (short-subunit alcohol dehydrogenase family)
MPSSGERIVVVMSNQSNIDKANVLITGGSEGIGKGLATRYLAAGSNVLITGRTREKLSAAAGELPGLMTFVNDIGRPEEREALAECRRLREVTRRCFPRLTQCKLNEFRKGRPRMSPC